MFAIALCHITVAVSYANIVGTTADVVAAVVRGDEGEGQGQRGEVKKIHLFVYSSFLDLWIYKAFPNETTRPLFVDF